MLVALLKVMELTCLEKLVPSAEISPGAWLGLGQEKEAGFAVGSAVPPPSADGHGSVLVLGVGEATGHWDRIKVG